MTYPWEEQPKRQTAPCDDCAYPGRDCDGSCMPNPLLQKDANGLYPGETDGVPHFLRRASLSNSLPTSARTVAPSFAATSRPPTA